MPAGLEIGPSGEDGPHEGPLLRRLVVADGLNVEAYLMPGPWAVAKRLAEFFSSPPKAVHTLYSFVAGIALAPLP